MQNFNNEVNNYEKLQKEVSTLQQSITTLLKFQFELNTQIERLTNVRVDDVVKAVIKEMNRIEVNDTPSFEDLLVLNAKMVMKNRPKPR